MNLDLDTGESTSVKRAKYYPSLREQLDLLWHAIDNGDFGETAKSSSFYTELQAVKNKYPK